MADDAWSVHRPSVFRMYPHASHHLSLPTSWAFLREQIRGVLVLDGAHTGSQETDFLFMGNA